MLLCQVRSLLDLAGEITLICNSARVVMTSAPRRSDEFGSLDQRCAIKYANAH
jgi:hypothetical protein